MAKQLEKIHINNIHIIEDAKRWSKSSALLLPPLSPTGYFRLDDRSTSDMIAFTKELVKLIRYYDLSDVEAGNWSGFLSNIDPKGNIDHAELIDKLEQDTLSTDEAANLAARLGPHEVLFLAFLSLLRYPRQQINSFSERYLNYYYRDYLELSQKPRIPAKGHVVFELDQNVQSVLLDKGTLLSAGKDSGNNQITYETENDLLVTAAQLASVRTLSGMDEDNNGLILTTIFDQQTDKTFTPKPFKTFGEQEGQKIELGFMISSEILVFSTGTRTLTLTITLDKEITIQPSEEVFAFYVSGEKQWLKLTAAKSKQTITDKSLVFQFALTDGTSNPKQYEPNINFNNNYPILKVVLNDFKRYKDLQSLKIAGIQLMGDTATAIINIKEESQFKRLCPLPIESQTTILPKYSNSSYLFLGFKSLEKGKELTMLWQAASGGVADDNEVRWEYWSDSDSWQSFTGIEDNTDNFTTSGIITFQVPEDVGSDNDLAQDQYWVRAVLDKNDDQKSTILDTLDIRLHATIASLYQPEQVQDDLSVLKAESINSLVQAVSNIKKVSQPYSGFDGEVAESEEQFLVRASSRLKHKSRALTAWDYERLVLAQFLEVYMVKATQGAPGEVIIEVIIDADLSTYPDQAQASNRLLWKIKSYLEQYKSATIKIVVKNAVYTEIHLDATVSFAKSAHNLEEKLDRDVKWFLSPWGSNNIIVTDQSKNLKESIYQSEIINFIKTRDYIELVRDVKVLFV